jgi:hypothetical protein
MKLKAGTKCGRFGIVCFGKMGRFGRGYIFSEVLLSPCKHHLCVL